MKNKYMTFVALAAVALATSCASDDLAEQKQNQSEPQTVTLTASVADDNTTRVGMTKDGTTAKFYWQSDDKILVQTQKDGNYSGAAFTATVNASDNTKAEFTGDIAEGTAVAGYAVYPYSENQKHTFATSNANELTYVLPATYTNYTPATQIFGNDGISTNMPMFGKIESGKITFKHLGGLAVIRVDKMPAESGTLTITADQQLSGNFTVSDLSADGAQIATTTASGDNGKVTFTFSGASTGNVGVFYLPLATGTYTNVKIALSCGTVNQTKNWSTLTINRTQITALPMAMNTVINGYVFVDLGLSVLWAETNVGASTAADFGNYYSCNNRNDAVSGWGTSCSLPTEDQFKELINNCNWSRTTQINSSNQSVSGFTVTSKKNGNSIFLPLAPKTYNGSPFNTDFSQYWSSTSDSGNVYYLQFSTDQGPSVYYDYTADEEDYIDFNYPVRPVAAKQ